MYRKDLSNKVRTRGLFLGLTVGLWLILVGTEPASAFQPDDIHWTVQPHFDGIVKYGQWLPIRVTVSNQGANRQVIVQATVSSDAGTTRFRQHVDLPAGAHKKVTLYVLPNSFSRQVKLSLFDGTKELLTAPVNIQTMPYGSFLVGLVARDPDALATVIIFYKTLAEESVVLEQNGRPVAALVPLAE